MQDNEMTRFYSALNHW